MTEATLEPPDGAHAIKIREAVLTDCAAVTALQHRLGLRVPADDAENRRSWERLWRRNPSFQESLPALPIGWVLEDDSRIVGFVGNIPMRYRLGDGVLTVGTARAWAVDRAYRKHTGELVRRYFEQPHLDLLLITTASVAAERRLRDVGAEPLPQRDYAQVFFWVVRPAGFLAAAFRKKGLASPLATILSRVGAPALALLGTVARRRPGKRIPGLEPRVVPLGDVGVEFDALWDAKCRDDHRLLSYRTAADLRWHFESIEEKGGLTILACQRERRLAGYAAIVRDHTPEGLVRARIVDIFVDGDAGDVIDSLLAAAFADSRQHGAHVLELVGFPRGIRAHVARYRPFVRRFPGMPFYYKALRPHLAGVLENEDAWYATMYDGDSSIGWT
jgi:hypothetical protein